MDPAALAAALVAATAGQFQLAAAGKMLQMNVNSDRSVVQLIDSAQQNISSLANVAAGIGTNLNTTA